MPISETGPSTSILPSVSVPDVRNPEPSTIDPVVKKQMAISFAEQSGMNAEWSLKYYLLFYLKNPLEFVHNVFYFTQMSGGK